MHRDTVIKVMWLKDLPRLVKAIRLVCVKNAKSHNSIYLLHIYFLHRTYQDTVITHPGTFILPCGDTALAISLE